MRWPSLGCLSLVMLLNTGQVCFAQRNNVNLDIGFNGAVIAEHWNPLKLTTRDLPTSNLVLRLDQGNLREGEIPATYRLAIPAHAGIAVFEDDVYIPNWRQFTWALQSESGILASGSFDRRNINARPLHLIVSAKPSMWLNSYPEDTRVLDISAANLPDRVAAFDGVKSILIDGTAAAPNLASLVALAVSGADVILLEPLPTSHEELKLLVQTPHLGAGRVIMANQESIESLLASDKQAPIDSKELSQALLSADLAKQPPLTLQIPFLIGTGLYLLLVLLLLRFGGTPGFVTCLGLAILLSFAAWLSIRPKVVQTVQGRSLTIGAGDLAKHLEVRTHFTFPRKDIQLNLAAYPLQAIPYQQSKEQLEFVGKRWSKTRLILKPRVQDAQLMWNEGKLHNKGPTLLNDVYVVGLGPQADLAASDAIQVGPNEDRPLPEVYNRLVPKLPEGSALARQGGRIHLALNHRPTFAWSQP